MKAKSKVGMAGSSSSLLLFTDGRKSNKIPIKTVVSGVLEGSSKPGRPIRCKRVVFHVYLQYVHYIAAQDRKLVTIAIVEAAVDINGLQRIGFQKQNTQLIVSRGSLKIEIWDTNSLQQKCKNVKHPTSYEDRTNLFADAVTDGSHQ